jgi:hypothetical protein
MDDDKNLLGGFMALLGDDIEDTLSDPNEPARTEPDDITNVTPKVEPVEPNGDPKPVDDKQKQSKSTEPKDDDLDDVLKQMAKGPVEPDPKDDKTKDDTKTEPDPKGAEPAGEPGKELISALVKAFAERNGWETDENDTLPGSVEEFMEYVDTIIEYNSKPEFASDELAQLNEYVKKGGNLRDYIEQTSIADEYNMESELDQRRAVSDLLKIQGYNSQQIQKKLKKYEDAGLLEDEATEAAETLKTLTERRKSEILEQNKALAQQREQAQRAYYDSVVENVKQMKDVRGVRITDKEKREVLEFLLRPGANGLTGFTEHLQKSVGNLIELAVFARYPDKLLDATKHTGAKTALDELKEKLRNNVQHKATSNVSYGDSKRFWEMI